MYKVALFARLEAKPGKENDVAKLLEAGLDMATYKALGSRNGEDIPGDY